MTLEQTPTEALDGVPAIYKLPASRASLEQNRFRFMLPDEGDRVRSIPKLKFLKPAIAVRIEGMPVQQAVIELLGTYETDLLDRLEDMEQLEYLVQAWAAASGVSLGESKPSSESSENTEGHSNTTSGPEATA